MMPSLKKKQEQSDKTKKASRFLQRGFPKGVLLEIGLFLCTDRFKVAFKYMRVCKTIYEQCDSSPRFWYFLFVQKYPEEFFRDFYMKFVGESVS